MTDPVRNHVLLCRHVVPRILVGELDEDGQQMAWDDQHLHASPAARHRMPGRGETIRGGDTFTRLCARGMHEAPTFIRYI